jgi:subtilisin
MAGQRREPEQRINCFLPTQAFQGDLAERMTRSTAEGRWSTADYESAQLAAGEMETRDVVYAEPDLALVTEIVQALTGNAEVRNAMTAAGFAPTDRTGPGRVDPGPANGSNGFVTLDQVSRVGPTIEQAFVIPEIGLISVPASPDVIERARSALQRIRGGAVRVAPAVPMYTVHTGPLGEPLGTEGFELPGDPFLQPGMQPGMPGLPGSHGFSGVQPGFPSVIQGEEPDEGWLEAALDTGAAAEFLPWGVTRVRAPLAWARGFLGQGARVAVVDTGVGPQIDLPQPAASATFVPGSMSANDDNGHGTHIAGTILARRNGIGVIGVAPKATLLRAKVLDRTGCGTDTQVAAGIVWAANQGANLITLSLGGGFSLAVQRALAYARSRRVTICAAAGNDYGAPVLYPARDPLCIAAAALDQADQHPPFSNRGPELELTAPGVNILATWLGNTYRTLNGTSTAAAHVAGTAALVLSRAPGLAPARLQKHLQRAALPLGPTTKFGRGLVQADRAVTMPILTIEGIPEALAVADNGHTLAQQPRQPAMAGGRGRA